MYVERWRRAWMLSMNEVEGEGPVVKIGSELLRVRLAPAAAAMASAFFDEFAARS